ncbi:MAG TPA: RagB/SusD family nutrient uptake outer membrane protein, partial [Puia sp.]|nr:RagB/SusD family nutrient uptake outer membrane protein [Puia sp.]
MKLKVVIFLASVLGVTEACNKLVKIPPPITSVTTETVFSSDTTAYSAIAAIYDDMSWHGASTDWANSIIANEAGMSADEMNDGYGAGDWFLSNSLFASASPAGQFWIAPYFDIYMANGVLEGLNASTKVTAGVRNQLEGEAKFLRALAYFYLTNLFGDLPLVLSTDFHKTALLHKSTQAQIYQQIVADLKDAQGLLPSDYSVYNSQRIRATKWAATALLARTYLYIDSFANAAAESSAVINNTALFGLDSLNGVFLTNSQESILQLATQDFYPYSTQEAQLAIPPCSTCSPIFYLTSQ